MNYALFFHAFCLSHWSCFFKILPNTLVRYSEWCCRKLDLNVHGYSHIGSSSLITLYFCVMQSIPAKVCVLMRKHIKWTILVDLWLQNDTMKHLIPKLSVSISYRSYVVSTQIQPPNVVSYVLHLLYFISSDQWFDELY